MSRRTRAALKAEMVLADSTATEEAALKMSTRSQRNREPLRPLTPNSVDSAEAETKPDQDMAGKNKKGKKKANNKGGKKNAKKGAKGGTGTMTDEENVGRRVEDEGEDNGFGESVASQQEVDHDDPKGMWKRKVVRFVEAGKSRLRRTGSRLLRSSRGSTEGQSDDSVVEYIPTERPASPSVKLGRSMRRRPEEPEQKARMPEEPAIQADTEVNGVVTGHEKANGTGEPKRVTEPSKEPVEADIAATIGNEVVQTSSQEPTPDAPSLTEESSAAQTPNASNKQITSPRANGVKSPIQGIEAMDALQEELDEVIKGLPNLDDSPDSPIKPHHPTEPPTKTPKLAPSKTDPSKSKPSASSTTKTTLSRTGSVRTTATNKLAKTTQPSSLSRSNSVKPSTSTTMKPAARPATTKPRPSSVIISKDDVLKENRGADYLVSRRRPISMQFPTPPPPPKSSKAPTKPTFTLPGDAIAAKLKAAREERLKREEEEERRRREFKARPVPGIVKTGNAVVRGTNASRARESLMGGVEGSGAKENRVGATAGGVGGLKRSSTVTGATSTSAAAAAKRGSVVAGRPGTSAAATKSRDTGVTAIRDKRASTSLAVPKRQSLIIGSNGYSSNAATRVPSNTSATSSTTNGGGMSRQVTTSDIAAQKQKAREIFNRDRIEKENREKERREKEDAARRARAEAAERGRLASREWAEKQKKAQRKAAGGEGVSVASGA